MKKLISHGKKDGITVPNVVLLCCRRRIGGLTSVYTFSGERAEAEKAGRRNRRCARKDYHYDCSAYRSVVLAEGSKHPFSLRNYFVVSVRFISGHMCVKLGSCLLVSKLLS